jgi:hypothetical protein
MKQRYRIAMVAAVLPLGAGSLLTAVAAGETSASPSDAAMNHRVLIDNSGDNAVLPAGVFCPGFDVQLTLVRSKEYAVKQTTASDGTVTERVTGSLVVSLENLSTGTKLTENVSGPSTATTSPDGSLTLNGQGTTLYLFGPHSQANTGQPGIVITHGNVTVTFNAQGAAASFSATGNETNVCAQLAG